VPLRKTIMSILFSVGVSSAMAQGDDPATKASQRVMTGPIIEQLEDERSPRRDRRLYELAVKLFEAIEAGTEQNVDAARHVMARALHEAAQGDIPEAWIDYGRCLWNGWGVTQDREAALAAYKKAAALGLHDAVHVTAYNLYWHFARYEEAHAWALRASKHDANGDAHYLLGLMAYHGRGRSRDIRESLRMHQQAARLGNADAMFELYVFSMNGIGDRETAAFFLKEAAQREQPRAMANLGVLYATGGLGFPKDPGQSLKWYRRAADKGHVQAIATLGLMALRGEGMPKDAAAAEAYFKRAEQLGYDVEAYLRKVGIARP
jgi:TPR repeat protein